MSTNVIVLLVWYGSGLLGCYLIWLADVIMMRKSYRCPTPRAVLGIMLGGAAGGCALLAGLFIAGAMGVSRIFPDGSWWATPICGPKHR